MSRAYLAFTEKGMALAHRLARALPGSVSRCGAGGVRLAYAEPSAHIIEKVIARNAYCLGNIDFSVRSAAAFPDKTGRLI